jgi:hypothetical protein
VKICIPVTVEAPDGATHYMGRPGDMSFYKMTEVGVAGEHWWGWHEKKGWLMVSHRKPHWIEPIPEEWKT